MQITSRDCTIREPVYGHKFDFGGLHSDLAHVLQGMNDDVFEFNVCGNLTHTCDGESNVSGCLKRKGKEYVLGRQQELKYSDGKMYLNFTNGGRCKNGTAGQKDFQLYVMLKCDYTLDANPIHIISYAEDVCTFFISFETPLACLPIPDAMQSNSCSVKYANTGQTFDLMPLSDSNYRTTDRQGGFFIINVCKPVLYGRNSMCSPGTSICLFSPKATDPKKRFINYGNVQSNPVIKDGQLLLRHESTTPCARNSSMNYTSVIYFYCDRTVSNAHPEFMGLEQDGCTNQFSFSTPVACENLKPCTALTTRNEVLDLSPLGAVAPHKLSKDGKTYTVAACTSAGEPCIENSGACYEQNGQTFSLGNFNALLRFNQSGSPYLLYEDGTNCGTNGRRWSTKIEFVCANNVTKDNVLVGTGGNLATDAVQIIEDSNCQLLIQYQTPHACQEQISCKNKLYVDDSTEGGSLQSVDLTPLINANENYEARIELPPKMAQLVPKNTKFFLNVCRPLVPKYQLGCAGGSGACMAKMSAAGAPEEEHSLGFPVVTLSAINRTAAELLYIRGDPCPTDRRMNLSTRIHFGCNMRVGRGQPVLRSIDDCNYRFNWDTSVICPPHECIFNAETCEIVQDDLNMRYSFKKAPFTNDGTFEIVYKESKVQVNICGLHRKAITDYSQDLVNLFFTHDLPGCGEEGKMNVQIRLVCSNKTEHYSIITNDMQCSLLHVQHTPSICSFLSLDSARHDDNDTPTISTTSTHSTPLGKPTTASPTTSSASAGDAQAAAVPSPTASVGTILGIILSVTFFVACVGMFAFSPSRRHRIRRIFHRNSSSVRYSVVQSNEEANLLLEPNGEFTESDDDMLL
ncbi:hypothetical protein KR222_005746 [Zaprionus bogoriensis]|nr:hypothetical protein KR222_005746 [Zaprionus bogoriensis]